MPSLSSVQFKLSSYEAQGRKWDVMKHKEVVLATAVLWCGSTSPELCFGGEGRGKTGAELGFSRAFIRNKAAFTLPKSNSDLEGENASLPPLPCFALSILFCCSCAGQEHLADQALCPGCTQSTAMAFPEGRSCLFVFFLSFSLCHMHQRYELGGHFHS